MAKPEKKAKKPFKPTPGKKAYAVLCTALQEAYAEYAAGEADDEDFTSPGKQKKVAKQIAKLHNRFASKKAPEFNFEELDEDPE